MAQLVEGECGMGGPRLIKPGRGAAASGGTGGGGAVQEQESHAGFATRCCGDVAPWFLEGGGSDEEG
jgi:hypothetical protein